jgi:hypothetical protein
MSYREKKFIPIFGMLLVLLYAVINVAKGDTDEIKQPLPPGLTDLAAVKIIEISDANGQTILKGNFIESSSDLNEVERTAVLAGDGRARGKANIQISKKKNGFTEKELEVKMQNLAARSVFKVSVDGHEVASLTTDATGKAELELSNENTK